MVFNQSAVSVVGTSEREAISGKNLLYTGLLCGKSEWTSLDECRAAAAQEDQLVTAKQQDGVEYAVDFVAASFACSASDNSSLFVIASAVTSVLDEYLPTCIALRAVVPHLLTPYDLFVSCSRE